MIFVTLGTNDKQFKRLLDVIEKEIKSGNIKEEVIVQAGYTKYKSNNMKIYDLMDMKTFNKNIKECRILITHGGVGTILDGIKKQKRVIAFPRLKKYQEHVNNHQIEIIKEFSEKGYIMTGKIKDLADILKKAENIQLTSYKSNNYKFNKLIKDYIDNI